MKLEVDNTTQQLLSELQSSIRGTISTISRGQEDIKETIDEMKETLIGLPSAKDMEEMRDDVNETSKKSVQNVRNSLEEIHMSISSLEKGIIGEENFKLLVVEITNYKKTVDEISNNINKDITNILSSQNALSENYYKNISRIEEDRAESFRLLNEKTEALISEIKKDSRVLLNTLLNSNGKNEEELKRTLATYAKTKDLEELVEKLRRYIAEQYHLLEEEYFTKILKRINAVLSRVIKQDAFLEQFEKQALNNLEKMLNDFNAIENLEGKNNQYLKDIVNYLMLPGYKRFFKGMETSYEESEI